MRSATSGARPLVSAARQSHAETVTPIRPARDRGCAERSRRTQPPHDRGEHRRGQRQRRAREVHHHQRERFEREHQPEKDVGRPERRGRDHAGDRRADQRERRSDEAEREDEREERGRDQHHEGAQRVHDPQVVGEDRRRDEPRDEGRGDGGFERTPRPRVARRGANDGALPEQAGADRRREHHERSHARVAELEPGREELRRAPQDRQRRGPREERLAPPPRARRLARHDRDGDPGGAHDRRARRRQREVHQREDSAEKRLGAAGVAHQPHPDNPHAHQKRQMQPADREQVRRADAPDRGVRLVQRLDAFAGERREQQRRGRVVRVARRREPARGAGAHPGAHARPPRAGAERLHALNRRCAQEPRDAGLERAQAVGGIPRVAPSAGGCKTTPHAHPVAGAEALGAPAHGQPERSDPRRPVAVNEAHTVEAGVGRNARARVRGEDAARKRTDARGLGDHALDRDKGAAIHRVYGVEQRARRRVLDPDGPPRGASADNAERHEHGA